MIPKDVMASFSKLTLEFKKAMDIIYKVNFKKILKLINLNIP